MKGDRKAGAPWGSMDGAKLCWEPPPLLVCGQEGVCSAADVLQRTLRSSADIIVSITAALVRRLHFSCFPRSSSGEFDVSTGGVVPKAVYCEPLRDVD